MCCRQLFCSLLRAENESIDFAQFVEILCQIASAAADASGSSDSCAGMWLLRQLNSAVDACNRVGMKSIFDVNSTSTSPRNRLSPKSMSPSQALSLIDTKVERSSKQQEALNFEATTEHAQQMVANRRKLSNVRASMHAHSKALQKIFSYYAKR